MGKAGFFFFGEEDEIKLEQFKVLFDIKDNEKAKELYIEIKTRLGTK